AERVLTVGGQLHAVFERLFGLKRVPELSDGHTLRLKHRPWRIARHDERAAPLGETLCPQALPRRPVCILGETAERGPRLVRLVERQFEAELLHDERMQPKHGVCASKQGGLLRAVADRLGGRRVEAAMTDAAITGGHDDGVTGLQARGVDDGALVASPAERASSTSLRLVRSLGYRTLGIAEVECRRLVREPGPHRGERQRHGFETRGAYRSDDGRCGLDVFTLK